MRAPDRIDRRIRSRRKALLDEVDLQANCGAPQRVKHSANHDGKRNDERQHQERIGAAARQDAIIDLKQIDGRSEEKKIVTAAIRENESERACAGPQGRLQWRLRR